MAYFWGTGNLPDMNTSNCHEIYTANDDSVLNVCDVASMKRPVSMKNCLALSVNNALVLL